MATSVLVLVEVDGPWRHYGAAVKSLFRPQATPEWLDRDCQETARETFGNRKPNLRKSSELFIVISKTWKQPVVMLSKESHASCQGGPLHWNKLLGFNSVS